MERINKLHFSQNKFKSANIKKTNTNDNKYFQSLLTKRDTIEPNCDLKTPEKSIINENTIIEMYEFAKSYENGEGVIKDLKKAFKWYKKAAQNNHVDAMYQLANRYQNGTGITDDVLKAFKWYKKAAQNNHVDAMYQLANHYEYGIGVIEDEMKAFKWYKKAAQNNHVDAMYQLANYYQNCIGVPYDGLKAFKWFKKAAQNNHIDSMYELAKCYYDNKHIVIKDEIKSFEWCQKILLLDNNYNNVAINVIMESLLKNETVLNFIKNEYLIKYNNLTIEEKTNNPLCPISLKDFKNESNVLGIISDKNVVKYYDPKSIITFLITNPTNPETRKPVVFYKG